MMKDILKLAFALLLLGAIHTSADAFQNIGEILDADVAQDDTPQDDGPIRIDLGEGPTTPQPGDPAGGSDSSFSDSSFDDEDEPDQKIQVNEKFTGWMAAGEGSNGGRVSETLRANWVMADSNGLLQGTVFGVDGANTSGMMIYLLNRGRLVTNTPADEEGNFEFNNVVEGAYSIVGVGENAFFCFSLNILHHTDRDKVNAPTRLDITAFQNQTTINNDWIRHFAPMVKFRVFGRYSAGEGEDDPAKFYGFQGLAQFQPAAAPATSINSHKVIKSSDGRLLGRVHQLNSLTGRPVDVRNTKIMLLKGDEVFDSTTTDNFGIFEFQGTPAGQYALVAAGFDGLGCIGIDVIESDSGGSPGASVFDFTMASSETVGWLNNLATELAYERAILARRNMPRGCQHCGNVGCNQCCPGGYGVGGQRPRRFFQDVFRLIDDWFERRFYGDGGYNYNYYRNNYYGY